MSLLCPHCFLPCPNRHMIPIPHSSPSGIDSSPRQIAKDNPIVNVVCHECGVVSAYSRQEVTGGMFVGTPDLFQENKCRLVATQVECDGENCEAPKTVHTVLVNDKGVWKLSIQPKDWQFSDSARCGAGHTLHLPKGKKLLWVALRILPW